MHAMRAQIGRPSSGVWFGTRTATHARQHFTGGAPYRSPRKNVRISSANASGCSIAAKCPPRGITVQRWMFVYIRSEIERGGRTISRGNAQ